MGRGRCCCRARAARGVWARVAGAWHEFAAQLHGVPLRAMLFSPDGPLPHGSPPRPCDPDSIKRSSQLLL
eukprot:887509-Pyramimonas_sp.AAC.1